MGHTEGNWEEAENCPKCNEITLFFMEEYDGEQGGTCQKCETSYQFIYKKEMVEVNWKLE